MATIADLLIKLGIQDEASAGLQRVGVEAEAAGTKTKGFGSTVESTSSGIVKSLGKTVAFMGIAGAAFGAGEFIKGGIDQAEALEKAHESLDLALQKTGGDATKLGPQFDLVASSAADLGISETDATTALARSVLLTGSAQKGMRAYQEALVISKGDHVAFTSALTATSKAQEGSTSSLSRYGIMLAKGTSGLKQHAIIMAKWGGQAKVNTLASDVLTARFHNMEASIGGFLLPAFLKLENVGLQVIAFLSSAAGWVKRNQDVIAPLAAGIGAVVVAFYAWTLATEAWTAVTKAATAAQLALDTALDDNPIGLIILAVIGLGTALYVLWTKSQTFRNIVIGVWDDVKGTVDGVVSFFTKTVPAAFETVLAWVKAHWPLIAVLLSGPFAPLVALATNAFGVRSALLGAFSDLWDGAKAVWHDLGSVWGAAWSGVWGIVKGFVNFILGGINAIIGAWDGLHFHFGGFLGVGAFTVSVPQIPKIPLLAAGAIAMGPTLAMIGEGREPEALLPLSRLDAMLSGGGRGGASVHVENMNVRSDEDVRLWARDLARRLGG